MKVFIYLILLTWNAHCIAQSYTDELLQYRQEYKLSLLQGNHPLKPEDTGYLRFYAPNPDYRVKAIFTQVTGTKPFAIKTEHGGKQPAVAEYGYVYFNLNGSPVTLYIYRFMSENAEDLRLFIPFTDRTNYKETFGGGRYLDISADDLKNNEVIIDFNKCYNPHTAYRKGYPYIVPPSANSLRISIEAGEKIFGHNPGY